MKTYTRDQLLVAQIKYNQAVAEHPEDFEDINLSDISEEKAIGQIDYLLSLVDEII